MFLGQISKIRYSPRHSFLTRGGGDPNIEGQGCLLIVKRTIAYDSDDTNHSQSCFGEWKNWSLEPLAEKQINCDCSIRLHIQLNLKCQRSPIVFIFKGWENYCSLTYTRVTWYILSTVATTNFTVVSNYFLRHKDSSLLYLDPTGAGKGGDEKVAATKLSISIHPFMSLWFL